MNALVLVGLIAATFVAVFALGAFVGVQAMKAYALKIIEQLERDLKK
jgi:hypothetical protein